jgi:hypothetical protein
MQVDMLVDGFANTDLLQTDVSERAEVTVLFFHQ